VVVVLPTIAGKLAAATTRALEEWMCRTISDSIYGSSMTNLTWLRGKIWGNIIAV